LELLFWSGSETTGGAVGASVLVGGGGGTGAGAGAIVGAGAGAGAAANGGVGLTGVWVWAQAAKNINPIIRVNKAPVIQRNNFMPTFSVS